MNLHDAIHVAGSISIYIPMLFAAMATVGVFDLWRGGQKLSSREAELAKALEALDAASRESVKLNAQWQALLAAMSDPVFLINHTGICSAANIPAKKLFGGEGEQTVLSLTQSPELDALCQEARTSVRANTGSSIAHPVTGEIALHYPQERQMHVTIHPITQGEGAAPMGAAFIVILRDLTELRRLETVRRDFVANVSHELRTPLSSIKAMAETLIDGALNDTNVAQHFLETIIRESDRLVRLSADLLDLSRVESRPVVKTSTDVGQLTLDVCARLAAQARDAQMALSIEVAPPIIADCDGDEIGQVLVNLLDNAIKYTPKGGSMWVSTIETESNAVFSVRDTGIGILQQDIPRLFERFYRADKARSRASGGTGLGLAIVKHIVERHGGRVWVESQYNSGSTFWFSIPLHAKSSGHK